jgi:PhzF family phenazine biosynthesis protein
MEFYIADAFTDQAFGGNTAGVVLYDDINDSLMQKIAAELRFSETAFVKILSENLFDVRYFTPNSEIELCGHATIAAFKVLLHLGVAGQNQNYSIKTLSGILQVYIEENKIYLEAGNAINGLELDKSLIKELCKVMSISVNDIGSYIHCLNPQIVSTGLSDIMLPVKSSSILKNIKPDYMALSEFSMQLKVVGVHAFTLGYGNFTAFCRNFAPLYGIDEESATGTSNASLTYYLYRKGVIKNLTTSYLFSQGECMNRPSCIYTRILSTTPIKILVGGNAHIIAKGNLFT